MQATPIAMTERAERDDRVSAVRGVAMAIAVCVVALLASGIDGSRADAPPTVRSCRPFVISKSHEGQGIDRFRAWEIKRSSKISCAMARRLLKATYGTGPLHVIRRILEPGDSGRPTYWLKGGWRCGNGAGGAACRNVAKPAFNVVENFGVLEAVTASTG
jgi:hypothetical protein